MSEAWQDYLLEDGAEALPTDWVLAPCGFEIDVRVEFWPAPASGSSDPVSGVLPL
jgi:hypothetical protein